MLKTTWLSGKGWFLFVALMVLVVAGSTTAAPQKITVLIHPTLYEATGGNSDQGVIAQFSKRTGIEVEVVTSPTSDLREKELIEFMARSGRYDVAFQLSSWMNDELFQYLEPLDTYVAKTGKSYDFKDIIGSLVQSNRDSKGKLRAIPFRVGTAMLYYNKAMLANKGLKVPKNWDEFYDAAQKLTVVNEKGETKVYGVVQTLYPDNKDYIRVLYGMGGFVLDEKMTKCTLNSTAAKKMVHLFKNLYSKGYMPKEVLAWDRDPQITALQQGRAAMGIFYSPYWGRLIDQKSTKIADQMGWAPVPTSSGVPQGRSLNDGWNISIDKNSRNKDLAWEFIIELTNKENQLIMAKKYANGAIRSSVYQSKEYLAEFPLANDWLMATSSSLFAPPHPRFAEIQDIMNMEITDALLNKKSTEDALNNAVKRINKLL